MEQIGWIAGHTCIYWSAVIRALAALGAIFAFLAVYPRRRAQLLTCAVGIPLALGLSLILSRMACWWFRPDSYPDLKTALEFWKPGQGALVGVFAGCLVSALLLRLVRLTDNLPELLDGMAIAAGFGIALGRLGAFFNDSDRGMVVPAHWSLPWADTVINPVSGMAECRLAVFLLQAMAAGGIFLVLLILQLRRRPGRGGREGDLFFTFLLLYAASQAVLDSTRYDALYFRSNGFVSVVQVLSVLALVAAGAWFTPRPRGKGQWLAGSALHAARLGCLALAGYMEYYVQRHGAKAVLSYSVMGAALALFVLLTLGSRPVMKMAKMFRKSAKNQPDTI